MSKLKNYCSETRISLGNINYQYFNMKSRMHLFTNIPTVFEKNLIYEIEYELNQKMSILVVRPSIRTLGDSDGGDIVMLVTL